MPEVAEGVLRGGLPVLALGSGPPLVVLRGFSTVHANPTGLQRVAEIRSVQGFARSSRVHSVGRAPGLAPGTGMAEIATQHAEALREAFDGPVDVLGTSSGGSVALQLAADHPASVRRLVLVAAGCTLAAGAREAQRRYVDAVAAGRRGAHHLAPFKITSPWAARALAPLMWLLDPLVRPADPSDMVAFARAEDGFDLCARLADVVATTLVVGGSRDTVYPPEILRRTAEGVRDGRLVLYPGVGHAGTMTRRRLPADVASFLGRYD